MPYLAEKDVSVPRVVAEGETFDGRPFQEREDVVYPAGAVIQEDAIASDVLEKLQDGDERLDSLLTHVSQDKAEELAAVRPGQPAPAVPEHEQEAEVFRQEGREVASDESEDEDEDEAAKPSRRSRRSKKESSEDSEDE